MVIKNLRNKLKQYKRVCRWIHKNWNCDVTSRKIVREIAVTKRFGTTGSTKPKAMAQNLLGTEVCVEIRHTRKNNIYGHTYNTWSSKLLKQRFYFIHSETMNSVPREVVNIEYSDHFIHCRSIYRTNFFICLATFG